MKHRSVWLPEDWEEYCILLLTRQWGADKVQRVPARHGGDLGIEAFTHDGHALQCYAPEDESTVKDRYENQRDKLTEDLGKLEKNEKELLRLLGGVRIKCYLFMVPVFDSSKIVQHASGKAEEYRQKSLPHLHEDFHIIVCTDDQFAFTRDQILRRPYSLIETQTSGVEEVREWILSNEASVDAMKRKLATPELPEPRRTRYIEGLITQYIEGANGLDKLRAKYPDQWEAAERYRTHKEVLLELEYPPSNPALGVVSMIAQDVQKELQRELPDLGERLIRTLSWASVAEWIMRCPLQLSYDGSSQDAA
ncbi:hypothetical protein [Nonomuraea sp. NPDC050202]|jgi:hypothetical protein|uniref:hypothetical protein n=1 Tax=Nonomuraea sp. NPDC050202 TaxID=3155035 RepID=UPI0033DE218A